jgi:hypothetical protein
VDHRKRKPACRELDWLPTMDKTANELDCQMLVKATGAPAPDRAAWAGLVEETRERLSCPATL